MYDRCVLGIDLGANSIGWALVRFSDDGPQELVDMGVRIFDAGAVKDIERGMDESPAVERRQARQRRRQTERQSRRQKKLANILQQYNLLPQGNISHGHARHQFFSDLDTQIRADYSQQGIAVNSSCGMRELPYFLRARALDHPLKPYHLGRALYHLAQRRGFLSNRKTETDDKETGKVKEGIAELARSMEDTGARTLGEFFFNIDPIYEQRIRNRWTARNMYLEEFEMLWAVQTQYHSNIFNESAKQAIKEAIFFQRPLKSQKGLVGYCDLEPRHRRAARALLATQRFRILQKVGDMRLHYPDGRECDLTPEQRLILADYLEHREEASFTQLRRQLKLDKEVEFNLERGGEKKIKGNTTATRIRKVMGDKWDCMDTAQKSSVISLLMGSENPDTLKRIAREKYGLDAELTETFAKIRLEEGYGALSKYALKKLLPLMEQGISFKTAEKQVYNNPDSLMLAALPPIKSHREDDYSPRPDSGIEIRNPVVTRTLTEMRKVVNAILKKYGKPDRIHLELARDLKRTREERKRIWQDNRKREEKRENAAQRIREKLGIPAPSRDDIEKVLLADECNWQCPYTGKNISMAALLGENPQFDIEHIIPFSRCLNNGFINKTLCYHEENRAVKRNRTPWEAYGDTENWEEIIERVKKFTGDTARLKLERFQAREFDAFDEIASQKLNDTRYASKLAARYLGLLYGADASKHLQTNTGQITAILRDAWRLNHVLGDTGLKNRDDHRHHAIDALVIALTTRSAIKHLSDAAAMQVKKKGRTRGFHKLMKIPWETMLQEVQEIAEHIIISRRISRKVRGRLHEDTNYSAPRINDKGKQCHAIRKFLSENFKEKDIDAIIDPMVRKCVLDHFIDNNREPKKAFGDPENHPKTADGTPIHKVRIAKVTNAYPIGKEQATRYISTDTNHHMEIIEVTDGKGQVKWEGVVVSLLEAVQRIKRGQSVIKKEHGKNKRFVFTITKGETFKIIENGEEIICVAVSISEQDIEMRTVTDARRQKDVKKEGGRIRGNAEKYRKRSMQKLYVTPLGEAYPAHD